MDLQTAADALRRKAADLALRAADDEPTFHFASKGVETLEAFGTQCRNAAFAWQHADTPPSR